MAGRVGYYAHHHGRGHVTRAGLVLPHVRAAATLFTSSPGAEAPGAETVRLPLDLPRDDVDRESAAPLHYAPTGHAGLRARMTRLAAWAADGPATLCVDVSVEVAVLGRLLSMPVAVVRQHGTRWDEGHALAYQLATQLVAPFPASLEEPDAPAWVRDKTVYVGGFSRLDGRVRLEPEPRTVAVLGGGGARGPGSDAAWTPRDVARAARATPGWRWTWIGAETPIGAPGNLRGLGWTDDPFPTLARAEVVIAHGGHNAVMEAAAADRPLVVVPAPRPFDEQARKAAALGRVGAAVVRGRWPEPSAWAGVLAEAQVLDPDPLRALVAGDGPHRFAAVLDELAESAVKRETR